MSGSPVYIGGKLIGAVAYTWAFTKEPVTGITPIREMLSALRTVPEEKLESSTRATARSTCPPAPRPRFPGKRIPSRRRLRFLDLRPEALRFLDPWLSEHGFVSAPGGGTPDGGDCDSIVPARRSAWSSSAATCRRPPSEPPRTGKGTEFSHSGTRSTRSAGSSSRSPPPRSTRVREPADLHQGGLGDQDVRHDHGRPQRGNRGELGAAPS